MKKLIALLLALTVVLGLAACGTTNTNETTAATTEATTEATTAKSDAISYDEFKAAALESEVTIQSCIQAVESWWDGSMHLYLQDAEGAYYIYQLACTEEESKALVPGVTVCITGYKAEWSGEVEIIDATYEIVEADAVEVKPIDATALLSSNALIDLQNKLVSFKGLTVAASNDDGAAFLYKWDGSGSQGDDLYFNVTDGENTFTFTVNAYMSGTGVDSDVYKAVEALKVGDKIDVEGFLYWYNGAQPHLTSVTPAA